MFTRWDGSAYPRPRPRGREALIIEGQPPPPPAVPNTRLWPFHIREAGIGFMAIGVSPRFSGPAIIKSVTLLANQFGGNPLGGFNLFYSDNGDGQGFDQPKAKLTGVTPIWENITNVDDQAVITANADLGPTTNDKAATPDYLEYVLDYVVWLDSFFLKIKIIQEGAAAGILDGWVRLFEGVERDQVHQFLG